MTISGSSGESLRSGDLLDLIRPGGWMLPELARRDGVTVFVERSEFNEALRSRVGVVD